MERRRWRVTLLTRPASRRTRWRFISIPIPVVPEPTGDDVTLSDRDQAYIHPDLTDAEYPGGVDGAQHPMLFHRLLRFHWSGPGPGSCFDMSSYDIERRKTVLVFRERYGITRLVRSTRALIIVAVVSDPNTYPLFESEVKTMDMGHHYRGGGGGMLTEFNDGAHAFWGSLGLFVDMDPVL